MLKNKGITVISLVITIIILLIIASISIGLLTGNNGLLIRAKQAKANTEIEQNRENSILNNYENIVENYVIANRQETQTNNRNVLWEGLKTETGKITLKDSIDNYDSIYVIGQYYEPGGEFYSQASGLTIYKDDYYNIPTITPGEDKFVLAQSTVSTQTRRIIFSFTNSTELNIDMIQAMRLLKVYGIK